MVAHSRWNSPTRLAPGGSGRRHSGSAGRSPVPLARSSCRGGRGAGVNESVARRETAAGVLPHVPAWPARNSHGVQSIQPAPLLFTGSPGSTPPTSYSTSVCSTFGMLSRDASCCARLDLPAAHGAGHGDSGREGGNLSTARHLMAALAAAHFCTIPPRPLPGMRRQNANDTTAWLHTPQPSSPSLLCTRARRAGHQHNEGALLLEEGCNHLVAPHVLVAVAPLPQQPKQHLLQLLLGEVC